MSRNIIALPLVMGLAVISALAQNSPRPDGFRDLILNQTTPEDAISVLGQPATDKVDRLDVSKIGKWLDPRHKEKIFRELTFKKVGDFYAIETAFLENKLVMITLEFKKNLSPPKLRNLFAVEFAVTGPMGLSDKPGQPPQAFFPTAYPLSYDAIAISDQSFIYVKCSTTNPEDPGRVDKVFQISRALEKK